MSMDRNAFELHRQLNVVYLGGRIGSSGAGSRLVVFPRRDSVAVASIDESGAVSVHDELLGVEGSAVGSVAVTARGDKVAVGFSNGFVNVWGVPVDITSRNCSLRDLKEEDDDDLENLASRAALKPSHHCANHQQFRAFTNAAVNTLAFDASSGLIAAGNPEGGVRVFYSDAGHCTHVFNVGAAGGGQGVTCLVFRESLELFAGTEAGLIMRLDLISKASTRLEHHVKAVTQLVLFNDSRALLSSGRDGILTIWNAISGKSNKTIVTEEAVEGLALFDDETRICTAGEKGGIRFWDLKAGVQTSKQESYGEVTNLVLVGNLLVASNVDGDIYSIETSKGEPKCVTIGNLDEVYDASVFGEHLAIAYNSNNVRLLRPPETDIWKAERSLEGHTNVILSIDVSGELLVSSSKDRTARLWRINRETLSSELLCVAEGHTDAVGAVALARVKKNQPQDFFVSGAADRTMKLWNWNKDGTCTAAWTVLAHDKDVNSLAVSPDNKIIASGSQDRTVKLWSRTDSTQIAVCKGHKRGVWSVAFSPVDRVVASASGDRSIKIWNTANGACLKNIEGHGAAVLKVIFISHGTQLASSGADGMIRVWNAKDGAEAATIDAHSDRVWALASLSEGDQLVSGAANGTLRVWKDISEKVKQEKQEKERQLLLKDQAITDAVRNSNWSEAFRGAVELSQPRKVEMIVSKILTTSGPGKLEEVVKDLSADDGLVKKLMEFCRDWNSASGNVALAGATQLILRHIFSYVRVARLASILKLSADRLTLDALIAYSQRHFERVQQMSSATSFLDFTLHRMRGLDPVEDSDAKDESMEQVLDYVERYVKWT